MKRRKTDELLRDVLSGAELDSLREATLRAGLSGSRQRRTRRKTVQALALVCLFLVVPGILLWPLLRSDSTSTRVQNPGLTQKEEQVRFISDEELFALFPNRPLALVGKPGQQQLVFLDELKAPPPLTR